MAGFADTIFALSSGRGRAAIAVIRISGPAALEALRLAPGRRPPPRRASLRLLSDPATGEPIDRALILRFEAGASATGEELVEIHCHGGPAIVARVLGALGRFAGFRLAEPGEFTRRAFAHGRIDLAEAEGLADLIEAETEAQRRQAMRQAEGALTGAVEGWRQAAVRLLAHLEAAIDFGDEDLPSGLTDEARTDALALAGALRREVLQAERGEIVRRGLSVVLLGPPNSGKSSLLNALGRRDAAIVTPLPGTTRDIVEISLELGGLPVTIADTAGLREAADPIEREGIRRARARAEAADLVLLVADAAAPSAGGIVPDRGHTLIVWNKTDLAPAPGPGIGVSALTGAGIDDLLAVIAARAEAMVAGDPPLVTRARQRDCIEAAASALTRAAEAHEIGLMAEEARTAVTALGRLTGRVDVEDVLDVIFGAFCIGK